MKLKNLFLILPFSSVFAQPAWEIPAENQTWYWIQHATSKNNVSEIHNVDFTKAEKLADGKFIYPYIRLDAEKTQWTSGIEWTRVDCQNKSSEVLGNFTNNVFNLALSPVRALPGSVGYGSMNMFCGTESDRSGIIYGVAAFRRDKNSHINQLGVMHKDIKLNSSNPSLVDFILYAYHSSSGETGSSWTYTADCDKKTISTAENNTTLDTNKSEFYSWRYSIQFACKFADEHLRNSKQNKSDSIINNSSLENAKTKCKSLGFKKGTEKFGNCVLELTK
jgi:hypothetical protein